MTKLKHFRLVCIFTLVLAVNIVMYAQPSSEKDHLMFHIGIKGVLDKLTGTELYEADFKLIDTRADSVIKSGKASRQWEEQGRTVKTSSFKIRYSFSGSISIDIVLPWL